MQLKAHRAELQTAAKDHVRRRQAVKIPGIALRKNDIANTECVAQVFGLPNVFLPKIDAVYVSKAALGELQREYSAMTGNIQYRQA